MENVKNKVSHFFAEYEELCEKYDMMFNIWENYGPPEICMYGKDDIRWACDDVIHSIEKNKEKYEWIN